MNRIDTQVMHPAAGRGVGHAVAGQTGREKTGARSCCAGFGNTRGAKGHLDDCAGKWDIENVADPTKVPGRKAARLGIAEAEARELRHVALALALGRGWKAGLAC
ncbi:hypothetical protein ERJ75_000701200 [Trypanosoma vivax]|nr:hypothetical protein ERJ75_000701200 [Trypanosoma vivax]